MQPQLLKYCKEIPRYTSYPTAPFFHPLSEKDYREALSQVDSPFSLYVHIPFCKSMCLFCGCSVILNRDEKKEEAYVALLMKEIDYLLPLLAEKKVCQLHFGGGTPTKLSEKLIEALMKKIDASFEIDFKGEVAIEIDPRSIDGTEKLALLKRVGFNRVSFGVQDTSKEVQRAIRRDQSLELTQKTFHEARALNFSINLDLIYGLPLQTLSSFQKSVEEILQLRPERLALFSYAKVPHLKPHQRAIPDHTLPSLEEKFAIYTYARERFIQAGYVAIGMDHFALETDPLALSYHTKTLSRNFQGYTHAASETVIGIGVSSIGYVQGLYAQNEKELSHYTSKIERGELPTFRGKKLHEEDLLRKWVIHSLMCRFAVDKKEFQGRFQVDFDGYFASIKEGLEEYAEENMLIDHRDLLQVTPLGELFIRNIASLFDAYLPKKREALFSSSI